MKNVVLLGDSIRLQYAKRVKDLLGEGYAVYSPSDNCEYTKFTLWMVRYWFEGFGQGRIDCIHWNNGIWDHHRTTDDGQPLSSLAEYLQDNERLYKQLRTYTPNLIWATTTPAGPAMKADPKSLHFLCREKWNEEIRLYNGACSGMLSSCGVKIDDLYSELDGRDDCYSDEVHLNDAGIEAVAKAVAASIQAVV